MSESNLEERVRMPGMINMENEENEHPDTDKVKNLKLNIPLSIAVDDSGTVSKGRQKHSMVLSPCSKLGIRTDNNDLRQRKRTRECSIEKMTGSGGGRVRSASAGRDKRTEMACRYWTILMENLRRAVDDLYKTCQVDDSCIYAREVIMELEKHTKDFKSLVHWLKMSVNYENTPPPQRPKSLTWDIRKTSPMGKATPVSTPGKLTPTKLSLCSPAKRQLNFEADHDVGSRVRSRQVSETIKEVGLEVDCSPHQSWQDLQNNSAACRVVSTYDEADDKGSEHEKSDSEQEKDHSKAESKTVAAEESNDPMSASTDSVLSGQDPTEPSSKSSSSGDLTKSGKRSVSKANKVVNNKSAANKVVSSSNTKPAVSKVSAARGAEKKDKTSLGGTKVTVTKKEKAEEAPKITQRPTSSFALTVKSTFTKSAAVNPSTVTKSTASASNPRITRAKTTISSSSKSSSSSGSGAAARKTAAGLLITTTTAKSKTSSAVSAKTPTSRPSSAAPGSPKQQRISLVARQSIFANENKNPNRKMAKIGAKSSAPPTSRPDTSDGNNNLSRPNPAGSNTSLSSGSSSRSWADTVRAGLTHRSVEDINLQLPGGSRRESVVDSDGWCTVRRSRARFSPLSGNKRQTINNLNKAKNRYKMPSSAMSLPSLSLPGESHEAEDIPDSTVRPQLERSVTSASIIRNRRDKAGLAKVVEKVGGSSNESLDNSDPAVKLKKKKDQINQTKKQEAQKKNSTEEQTVVTVVEALVHNDDSAQDDDSEEITARKKAIAEAEMEEIKLEIQETEQAELTDDMTDDNTDTDTADTRSEAGTVTSDTGQGGCGKYETLLETLSWADQMELEEQLDGGFPYETRLPGRAIQLHDKLSSPARSREPHTLKHCQEKQDKARQRRLKFAEEKSSKLVSLLQRKQRKQDEIDKLTEEMKDMIGLKLKKAEELRSQHIEEIKKKAHKEEEKLREIAFINELQAQNNKLDIIYQVEHAEENCGERLAEIAEERAKKAGQREEREAKAEERRKAIEREKLAAKTAMLKRRQEREERIKEKEAAAVEQRKVSAAMKHKVRQERLEVVRAAEQDMKEELQGKIQQKQEDAAKRHAEHLDDIRQKAWEMSLLRCSADEKVPNITNYQVQKKCEVCNVFIKSEVHLASHLRAKHHIEMLAKKAEKVELSLEEKNTYNLKHIVDAPEGETDPQSVLSKERLKNAKKKAKKIKSKMAGKAAEYVASLPAFNKHQDSPNRARIGKSLREIEKLLGSQGKGAWPNSSVSSLERAFGEISRAFEKNSSKDQDVFRCLGGFDTLEKIYFMLSECGGGNTCVIPLKSLVSAGKVLVRATANHQVNTEYMLLSNRLTLIVDILLDRLAKHQQPGLEPEMTVTGPDPDPVSQSLMSLLSSIIGQLSSPPCKLTQLCSARLQDIVSYIVCMGTVDSLAGYFTLVRDPIDNSPEVAQFLLTALQLLTSLTSAMERGQDPSHLLSALQGTELGGTVSMLYGMLLHQGRDHGTRDTVSPAQLPQHTLDVSIEACTLLHRLVRDHHVQNILGSEGISLEFRHIASYLLYYCQHHHQTQLLNLVIVLVGYFTANHPDNQSIVQSGSQPSVLQQLCNLEFQYFSQPDLKAVLFPSLLSCCHNNEVNMAILSQEMSWKLIEDFVKTEQGQENALVKLVTKQ